MARFERLRKSFEPEPLVGLTVEIDEDLRRLAEKLIDQNGAIIELNQALADHLMGPALIGVDIPLDPPSEGEENMEAKK